MRQRLADQLFAAGDGLYYLVPGTAAHTEIRYVLPMHGLLIVFSHPWASIQLNP